MVKTKMVAVARSSPFQKYSDNITVLLNSKYTNLKLLFCKYNYTQELNYYMSKITFHEPCLIKINKVTLYDTSIMK